MVKRNVISAVTAAAVVTAVLAAAPVSTPGARADAAGCGGVRVANPARRQNHQRPPLAIGDSTMLLALYNLAAIGYEANAHGCRELGEALALIRARKRANTLPYMVVIALGADGTLPAGELGRVLGELCCRHLLVLVTPRELGGGSGADAQTVRAEGRMHPHRIKVLDWVHDSAGHPDWFQPDGLHLTTAGATGFTRLLARAVKYAYPTPLRTPPKPAGTDPGHPPRRT